MTTPVHQYAPEHELTKLNDTLRAFIGNVHKDDVPDGEPLEDAEIKETKVYKDLETELKTEAKKKFALEEDKKELKLRVESAEAELKTKKTEMQAVLLKEKDNRRQVNTLREENKFLKEFNEKEINELRQQMQESEALINEYKFSWMEEMHSIKTEYKGIIDKAETQFKEENKMLMERMIKMKEQHQQSNFGYKTSITKLTNQISSQQEEIERNKSSIKDLRKAKRDLDKELATYRQLLKEGYKKIDLPVPDFLGNQSPKPNPDGNTKTPDKDQNQGKPKSSNVQNPPSK